MILDKLLQLDVIGVIIQVIATILLVWTVLNKNKQSIVNEASHDPTGCLGAYGIEMREINPDVLKSIINQKNDVVIGLITYSFGTITQLMPRINMFRTSINVTIIITEIALIILMIILLKKIIIKYQIIDKLLELSANYDPVGDEKIRNFYYSFFKKDFLKNKKRTIERINYYINKLKKINPTLSKEIINRRIFNLFGLTDEEIKIIEESV